jgi:hypothetical protein
MLAKRIKDGKTAHPLYQRWYVMRQRCEKPYMKTYKFYGARGIRVCDEWRDFWTFVNDMGPRPTPKMTPSESARCVGKHKRLETT